MPHILFTTSTMPSSDTDPVPGFVKDEAIWLNKLYPKFKVTVLAPHNGYDRPKSYQKHQHYTEYRFHYFWPFRFEKLTGRGIQPALKQHKWLYVELPFLVVTEFFATWRLVRKLKPDLLYAHWFTPQALTGALVSKLTGTPLIFDSQASDVIVLKHVPLARHIVAAVCKQAYAYTVPSQQTADKLLYFATDKNRAPIKSRLHMIPFGTAPVAPSRVVMNRLRKQYGLVDKKIIYFVGRLVDRKGIDILIKAFAPMSKRNSTLRLVIAGDGQHRAALETLVAELNLQDRVIFTGYVTGETKYGLLGLADVCALPSINVGDQSEGLPIVFMEGVTAGKAMVISDATGAHEVVQDGANAFVAKAGSASSLRKKLSEALAVEAKHDKAFYAAVAKLAKDFQWPSIIKRRYKAFKLDEL